MLLLVLSAKYLGLSSKASGWVIFKNRYGKPCYYTERLNWYQDNTKMQFVQRIGLNLVFGTPWLSYTICNHLLNCDLDYVNILSKENIIFKKELHFHFVVE